MAKNFNKKGFTNWGIVNYGYLRSKGIESEDATRILIDEDALKKDARTFRHRRKHENS